jgi:plastocyanin
VKFLKLSLMSAVLVGMAACFGHAALPAQSNAAPPSQQVKIDNFSFAPQQLTVAVGTTILWVNNDDVPHTVVGAHQEFRSKALDTNDHFSFTFTKAGTFDYFCSVHPMMTGKIVVQ